MLPVLVAMAACDAGWAEPHPLDASGRVPKTLVMVFAPRDDQELDVGRRAGGDVVLLYERQGRGGGPFINTMNTRIEGVRRVALTVSDLDHSARWYLDVLGFAELFRKTYPDRFMVILRVPDGKLVLGLVHFVDQVDGTVSPWWLGLDHLCFAVTDRRELDAWVSRLDNHGVPRSGLIEMATRAIVNFKDPDVIALAFAIPPQAS